MPSLLTFVCVWCLLTATAGQEEWARREASTTAPKQRRQQRLQQRRQQENASRDPLLFNMLEALISSLDEKFQHVTALEQGLHTVLSRIDQIDTRLQKEHNATVQILTRMDQLERQLQRSPHPSSASAQQSSAVDARLRQLQLAVAGLQRNRTATGVRGPQVKRKLTRGRGRTPDDVSEKMAKDVEKTSQSVSELMAKVDAVEASLSTHMSRLLDGMAAVTGVLLETPGTNTTTQSARPATRSKLDVLVNKIEPLMDVSAKMDEVWNVVVGTKSSVDDLVPKSDELIHTTSRQERAINNIHSDLQARTKQIIDNLNVVERRLSGADAAPTVRPVPPPAGRRTTSNSKRYIRPLAFPTRPPPSTTVTISRLDKEAPFDLLDEQFLTAYENQTARASSPPARVVPRVESRGGPGRIVFPGHSPATGSPNTSYSDTGGRDRGGNGDAYSCSELLENGVNKSGVYYLRIHGTTYWYLKVFCDMQTDGGGWTVIQRRGNYREENQHSFHQAWEHYKQGFGQPTAAFWLGNENIFMLTNEDNYQLRIELEDFDGESRYAQYDTFKLHGEEDNYKLEIGGYEGNAGDSMNDPWYGSNLNPFSTFDRDNDRSSLNCADMLKGGWWWRSCGRGLNGLYLTDPNDVIARQGIVWYRWRGWDYSLKRSVMMIRPKRATDKTSSIDGDGRINGT